MFNTSVDPEETAEARSFQYLVIQTPSIFVLEALIRITKYWNEQTSAASSESTEVLNMLVFCLCYLYSLPYKIVAYDDD